MIEAGREKHLAEDLIKMVCFLCVVVDGGWSKRSHKHLCNANPGVGIIVKGNCSTLACGTNSALLASPRKHLTVSNIGMPLLQKWKLKLLWRGLSKQNPLHLICW